MKLRFVLFFFLAMALSAAWAYGGGFLFQIHEGWMIGLTILVNAGVAMVATHLSYHLTNKE